MKKNIILIGMPGVGKSTVGVVLAKVMGYQFIDADLVIQEKEGKLLREIIAEVGPEGFLKVENRINSGIEAEHAIIATGGSVVYGAEAMEHLSRIGTVVYLKLPYRELERRLSDIKGRGVVLSCLLYTSYSALSCTIDTPMLDPPLHGFTTHGK